MAISRRQTRSPVLLALLCASACGGPDASDGGSTPVIDVWVHSGQEAERAVLEAQVERFNRAHAPTRVDLTLIPEGGYRQQVQAAALAGDLPDVMALDGPFVSAYAWRGHLRPLDELLPDSLQEALLPSIVEQGRHAGRLWAAGAYDSGLGLFARRSALEEVGARIPESPGAAWTADELETVMARLADEDADGAVMDLHLNNVGEWYTYAFAPTLRSGGDGLVDVEDMRATGTLDSPESVRVLERIQGWIRGGLVDPNIDDAAFTDGRVALSWSGHWDFARYREAWGEDVVVLPLPDFGEGSRTGQGSWMWAVTSNADDPVAAADWIRFLLEPSEVRAMSAANSAVPALAAVAAESPLYEPGGPLALLYEQLREGFAVPRPRTPAYPIVTSAFQEAFDAIRTGAPVRDALASATRLIDREIEDNQGYPRLDEVR